MKYFTGLMKAFVVLALFCLIFPQKAYAYLDPATGSLILQLIMAGLFATLLAVKIFWVKIKAFFSNHFSRKGDPGDDES